MIPGLAVLSNTSVESDPNTTMTIKGTREGEELRGHDACPSVSIHMTEV